MYTKEQICESLDININDILNIYPYGSQIYGTADEYSDHDYIIVYKKSILPSGAFKDNAKSSKDRMIQGTCYSKGGFLDAINTYQMPALESIFLPEDKVIMKTFDFKITKFDRKEFCKKVITLASASWHNASLSFKDDNIEYTKKNIYHTLRILDFGIQILEHNKIINYDSMNDMKTFIYTRSECDPKDWNSHFLEIKNKLK